MLILFFEMIVYFTSGFFIIMLTDHPYLILPLLIVFFVIHYSIKRNKKIMKYVKKDFEKYGFEILEEKPISQFQSDTSVKPAIIVNGLPLSRYGYMRKFGRIFKAKYKDGQLFELTTLSIKMWSGKNKIEIKKKNICLLKVILLENRTNSKNNGL